MAFTAKRGRKREKRSSKAERSRRQLRGHPLIGGSCVVNPDGEIVAQTKTEDDELIVHACDLDATAFGKKTVFDFARHRRIEHYGVIASQTGAVAPPDA